MDYKKLCEDTAKAIDKLLQVLDENTIEQIRNDDNMRGAMFELMFIQLKLIKTI